jgi:hypothetical protein
MEVDINTNPLPNGIDIGGNAVALNCKLYNEIRGGIYPRNEHDTYNRWGIYININRDEYKLNGVGFGSAAIAKAKMWAIIDALKTILNEEN